MKLISSRGTFFQKRVFPCLWFGILALVVVMGLATPGKLEQRLPLFLVPGLMAVIGYAMFSRLLFDLVDEVYDLGDALLVRNRGIEARIPLTNIINVNHSAFTNPPRMTLSLRQPCDLGKTITFMMPLRFNPFQKSTLAAGLIERIDATRLH